MEFSYLSFPSVWLFLTKHSPYEYYHNNFDDQYCKLFHVRRHNFISFSSISVILVLGGNAMREEFVTRVDLELITHNTQLRLFLWLLSH